MIEIQKLIKTTEVSPAQKLIFFINAINEYTIHENLDGTFTIDVDITSIIDDMKHIEFDEEGPICSDSKLMDIFRKAKIVNLSDTAIYNLLFMICCSYVDRYYDYVMKVNNSIFYDYEKIKR